MAVGDELSYQVDQEVMRAAMARVLDLADVRELVNDRLDERTRAQGSLIVERQQPMDGASRVCSR